MRPRFTLFRRGQVFYCEDTLIGKQLSLRTKDQAAPSTLLSARNESQRQPTLNLHLARTKELHHSHELTDDDHLFGFLRLDLDWIEFGI